MSELDIIRAWKDKTYRNSLSADELAQLPEHPAGAIELTDDELGTVEGADIPTTLTITSVTIPFCTIIYCTITYCTNTFPTPTVPVTYISIATGN
jgi:mersacidin/lichenicidin family type 2 lantibiotic